MSNGFSVGDRITATVPRRRELQAHDPHDGGRQSLSLSTLEMTVHPLPPGCHPQDCCGDPTAHLAARQSRADRRERYAAALYAAKATPARRPWKTLSRRRRAVWYARADAAMEQADEELRLTGSLSSGTPENARVRDAGDSPADQTAEVPGCWYNAADAEERMWQESVNRTAESSACTAEAELYVLLRTAGQKPQAAQANIDQHRDQVLRGLADGEPRTWLPRRGDLVEAWLKTQRDQYGQDTSSWLAIDNALDYYRLHADTSTPLAEHVCEGLAVGDCEHQG